jgi:hypothetical protein
MNTIKSSRSLGFLTAIVALIGLLSLPLLVPAIWLFTVFDSKYRQCIPLRNGLNLGYEAVFDLSKSYFKPIAVPRFADGTPVIRHDMWAIYLTNTTLYGWALGQTSQDDYWFAWRADAGLVKQAENDALYKQLVAAAGHANWDFGSGSFGTGWMLNELIKRPEFNVHRCPTALITW